MHPLCLTGLWPPVKSLQGSNGRHYGQSAPKLHVGGDAMLQTFTRVPPWLEVQFHRACLYCIDLREQRAGK